jgi:hypothetical protein
VEKAERLSLSLMVRRGIITSRRGASVLKEVQVNNM